MKLNRLTNLDAARPATPKTAEPEYSSLKNPL